MTCRWCSGEHLDTTCPRVSSFGFHPDGSLAGVSFMPGSVRDDMVELLSMVDPEALNERAIALIGVAGDTIGECTLAALASIIQENG